MTTQECMCEINYIEVMDDEKENFFNATSCWDGDFIRFKLVHIVMFMLTSLMVLQYIDRVC